MADVQTGKERLEALERNYLALTEWSSHVCEWFANLHTLLGQQQHQLDQLQHDIRIATSDLITISTWAYKGQSQSGEQPQANVFNK